MNYHKYEELKSQLPNNLTSYEYQEEIKKIIAKLEEINDE